METIQFEMCGAQQTTNTVRRAMSSFGNDRKCCVRFCARHLNRLERRRKKLYRWHPCAQCSSLARFSSLPPCARSRTVCGRTLLVCRFGSSTVRKAMFYVGFSLKQLTPFSLTRSQLEFMRKFFQNILLVSRFAYCEMYLFVWPQLLSLPLFRIRGVRILCRTKWIICWSH